MKHTVRDAEEEFSFTPQLNKTEEHHTFSADVSPPSKETSPLRLSQANFRASKDDFRYLNAQMNSSQTAVTDHTKKLENLQDFIPSNESIAGSSNTSPIKYNQYQSQGEFQFRSGDNLMLSEDESMQDARSNFSFDDNSSVDFTASPTKQLNIQSDHSDLGLNHTVSSLVNTSIHTQMLLDNNLDSRQMDDDPTPVVPQKEFPDTDKTPRVPQTESLSDMRGKDIFETGDSHLLEDLSSVSISAADSFNFNPASNRIQSTTSSVYSEMPRATLKKPTSVMLSAIPESGATPQSRLRQNVQSTTSSLYSDFPAKQRTSNVKSLNTMAESQYSPTKTRVSIRDQSLYQDHYNTKTGELTIRQDIPSPTTRRHSIRNQILPENIVNDDDINDDEDDDASALFVTSLYEFNAETLESQNDSAICLSFDENEVAFTYKLDDSGWGEVTLLSTLKRGWVPMNYFRSTVTEDAKNRTKNLKASELAGTRSPIKLLLKHAGTFLLNPHSKPVSINGEIKGYTFDVESFNGMTDGIRKLLIDTDCISRSSFIVQKKPVVRKMRKKLLRGWAELVAKAKDYMGTVDTAKIEYLQLLTFQVLQKSVVFLDIWGLEKDDMESATGADSSNMIEGTDSGSPTKQQNSEGSLQVDINYLDNPPFTKYRINEVYNQLLSYLALIAGRIDLVEHNAQSFSVLGVVVSQINLLISEYLFIMKFVKAMSPETDNNTKTKQGQPSLSSQLSALDLTGEKLKTLIDDLNAYVSSLHTISKRDMLSANVNPRSQGTVKRKNRDPNAYFYSREGSAIVVSCCKMIELSSICYRTLKNLMVNMEDFQLPNNRKYPNYLRMVITPSEFITKGTLGLMKSRTVKRQLNEFKRLSTLNPTSTDTGARASKRFSMFKVGNSDQVKISNDGLDFLSHVNTGDDGSPFMTQDAQFDTSAASNLDYRPDDEIMRSSDNKLIGVSFKALVYLLTDENISPDYYLISTFFLTFRIFSTNSMLLEALIERFDINDDYKRGHLVDDLHMRSRRQLIAKTFQMWLESYWQPGSDYILLAPMMNFFNEAMKNVLPVEGYKLLVLTSKLIGSPPVEHHKDKLNYANTIDSDRQLLPRKLSPKLQKKHASRMSVMMIGSGLTNEIDTYNAFLEDIEVYNLEKIESDDNFDYRKSQSFNLNLELKNSDNSSSLVTTKQLVIISTIVQSYRNMLGSHWVGAQNDENYRKIDPIDTKTLIDSWWITSQETWKIMNDELSLLNFNGLEIAKQLTLIESKMFCSIKVGELLNQNFTTKKLHLNLSPNIQRSILFTNLLSDYVIESILRPNIDFKQRTHAFKAWLKIAISCLYLRNFNSLTSIITSLQSFLITRVTAIWDGISPKYKELFEYLTSIIHPNKNYNIYREKLRDFIASNLKGSLDIPTVPYLSLFLQDLTFVVDGNPNHRTNTKSFLEQKLINIDKYFKITKIISDIQTLQVSYKDTGELGAFYNDHNVDIARSETIKNLQVHLNKGDEDLSLNDMFDIKGLPLLQELILLEIWKVKQTNDRDDDRSWKLSCALQPKETE